MLKWPQLSHFGPFLEQSRRSSLPDGREAPDARLMGGSGVVG